LNISYLNLPLPPLSFIPLPQFLDYFQQVSFLHLYTGVYIFGTILTLLPPFPTNSPLPLLLISLLLPQAGTTPPTSDFVEEKKRKDKKKNMAFLLV
jgi:hypothetical protein